MISEDTTLQEIDVQAPVVGSCEIEVAADPEAAWAVLTQIERWPSWNPAIKSVSFEGGLEEGSEFRWKAGPGTIRSTIRDLDPPWRIAWTGTSLGLKAIHVHTFERHERRDDRQDGGVVPRARRPPLQRPAPEDARRRAAEWAPASEDRSRAPGTFTVSALR